MLDVVKLLFVLCRDGGGLRGRQDSPAPAPDDEGRDVVKPLCLLLRSLSTEADPLLMAGGRETVSRLMDLGSVRGLPERVLTPVIWTVSNLARAGTALQDQLRDAGALRWLVRVTQVMNNGGSGLGREFGGGVGDLGGDAGGGSGGEEEAEVRTEVAAVLAALTNLANGNPANQSRLRGEEGLMEALTSLVDDPEADGSCRRAAVSYTHLTLPTILLV